MSSSLHNHTEYSLLDGFGHPEEYLEQAVKLGLKAFAVTEHGNEYSWVYFDELKEKYPQVKMIYGVELYECFNHLEKDKNNKYFHLIALAKNEQGRIALNELVTKSNFEGFYFKPRVDLEMMKPYADNLIVSTACLASKLSKEDDFEKCEAYIQEYRSVFPHFYLEMQSHNTEEQAAYNQKILALSQKTNTPFIITTDSHAASKEDLKYQEYHVRIAHDAETESEIYSGCYMQSDEEIHAIMDSQIGADNVSKGLAETDSIADMIEEVHMPFQPPQLPTYPLPDGFEDNADFLRSLCKKGWTERHFDEMSEEEQTARKERMEYELSVIHQMGFDGYFLIVWDFIHYAKSHDIIVGDGRGSGGGSIVNYLIGISELDPIKYDLIFERFLNPERISMPDIDIDFADRESVINYLCSKYGNEKVCQIINFSYITPVVAIKDVGRVLGIPYYISDKISKKFTYQTFQECLDNAPEIYEKYASYHELFDIASHISGRVRNASIHAGGVGIVDTKITDYMAMKAGGNNERVIQVDKRKIEEIGIIKFDILGVATLGIVQEVKNAVGLSDWDLSAANPSFLNDKKTYELLQSAKTNGVFQVESSGMKDLLSRLQPTNLEDMSAVLALYRPDSMSMLEDYIYYKHHPSEVKYLHPHMQPILEKTYGCIIYQEEIMDIVRVFGGRSRGGADLFRKAIGKKDIKLVKDESEKLYSEIVNQGYDLSIARQVSDYMAQMGGYSFNKCLSGDTRLFKAEQENDTFYPTIAEMYQIRNNIQYAKKTGHFSLYKKYQSKQGYGDALSLCSDGRIRKNKIVDIRYSGQVLTYILTTESGRTIRATGNHKFPTKQGKKLLSDLKTGDELYVMGECEACTNQYNFTRAHCQNNHLTKTSEEGIPSATEKIISIQEYKTENVYDIEMADPYHNFVVESGIVTCNSHSALYSLLTLKTAYLKAHYPAYFFCALLNQNKGNYGTINKYILDAKDFQIEVLPPDLNRSSSDFTVQDGKILFGLEAINGIGKQLSDQIIECRKESRYQGFLDFANRVNPTVKQVVQLAKAGAFPTKDKKEFLIRYARKLFEAREYRPVSSLPKLSVLKDTYGIDPELVKDREERIRLYNQVRERNHKKEQAVKFQKHMEDFFEKYLKDEPFWEFEALSVFIKSNPFEEAYRHISKSWDETENEEECVVVGVISNVQKKKDRNKNPYAFINLYSAFGLMELTCWSSQFKRYEELIKRGNQISVFVKKKEDKAIVIEMTSYQSWLDTRKLSLQGGDSNQYKRI